VFNKKTLALLIITIFLAATPVFSVMEPAVFTFNGQGYGHGLGLSQYGARGFALRNFNYVQILATYYQQTQLSKAKSQTIRVLVASKRSQVNFSAPTNFSVYSEPLKRKYAFHAGQNYQVTVKGGRLLIKNVNSHKDVGLFTQPLQISSQKGVQLISTDDNGRPNNPYRGFLRLLNIGNRIYAVNHLNSEHYLFGVITREMPLGWPAEALKSQAVAARSFALSSLNANKFYDVYTTTTSQVYGGLSAETPQSVQAVKNTANQVLTFQNQIIKAFYHSSSGGFTENNENVWGSKPLPWLRGVSSPYEGNEVLWPYPVSFSAAFLEKKLGAYSNIRTWGVRGVLNDLVIEKQGISPRVLVIRIVGSGGISYISGEKLRKFMGLRSTWFSISKS